MKDLLRLGYYFCKDIIDFKGRERLKKNIILRDQYLGKRIFLLLTGESLKRIDISKLRNEYTFGTAHIFLYEDFEKVDLSFYMNAEPFNSIAFTENSPYWPKAYSQPLGSEGIVRFYKEIDKWLGNKTTLILHNDNYKYIQRNNLFIDKKTYFIKGKKDLQVTEGVPYQVVADLTKRRISGGGSIFFSILSMMYMGFKEIYLCGAGYTYDPTYHFHFYDNFVFPRNMGRQKAENEAKKAIEACNNRSSSTLEYYGLFEKDDFYRSVCVIKRKHDIHKDRHLILNNYAKSQGLKIYNIVPDGFESSIYEKISWQEVESKVLSGNSKNKVKK